MKQEVLLLFVAGLGGSTDAAPCLSPGLALTAQACTYAALETQIGITLATQAPACRHDAATELRELLGLAALSDVRAAVADACSASHLSFRAITAQGAVFDKAYFDGGTYYNDAREEEVGLDPSHEPEDGRTVTVNHLQNSPGSRIKDIYDNIAQNTGLDFPDHLRNFQDCDLNAVMCCFTVDRQAGDHNGDCAAPYAEGCENANPGDNTDLCYVDMTRSPTSAKKNVGFAVYEGSSDRDPEEPAHCHGFAFADDPSDPSARFRGSNLFYMSFYDHLTQRGYAHNVPGAPMCGCLEQMPVVTRSDCTQVDVEGEDVAFEIGADRALRADVTNLALAFNACQGVDADGAARDNDLEAHYRRLVNEDKIAEGKQRAFGEHVVGETYCREAIDAFLDAQGFAPKPACAAGGFPETCGCAEVRQADYRGDIHVTKSGRTCQRWDAQSPQQHGNTRQNLPDANLVENYCRNPDGETGAWCYTTDPEIRWEYCEVPICGIAPTAPPTPSPTGPLQKDCGTLSLKHADYRGDENTTENGRTCQKWTDFAPHQHSLTERNYPGTGLGDHNYCRNPDGEPRAWCYTTDPATRWEYCDVPNCEDGIFTRNLRGN